MNTIATARLQAGVGAVVAIFFIGIIAILEALLVIRKVTAHDAILPEEESAVETPEADEMRERSNVADTTGTTENEATE